jgi:hypothetical protein
MSCFDFLCSKKYTIEILNDQSYIKSYVKPNMKTLVKATLCTLSICSNREWVIVTLPLEQSFNKWYSKITSNTNENNPHLESFHEQFIKEFEKYKDKYEILDMYTGYNTKEVWIRSVRTP